MESLKLKTKLLYLFLSVGFGLSVIALIGYYNLATMKKNADTLYFGSLLPLNELTSITSTYHHQLESSVYQADAKLIGNEQLAQNITVGLNTVDQLWASYLSHHKRPEETPYLAYAKSQMDQIKAYFIEIRNLAQSNPRRTRISLVTLSDNITAIQNTFDQLISYEIAAAKYEHSILLTHHKNSLTQLIVLLAFVLLLVMTFAWKIFTRIESQQHQLVESTNALKHLNTKLELASYTDTLTSIYNRRYFNLIYERELKRAKRSGKPITFMMVDIDFFKQYNDTYGHIQGDNALIAVAKALKNTFQRPGDYPFRLGGEEFGVIITDSDSANARKMAERLRTNVENLKIEHKGSKVTNIVTISVGAVCLTPSPTLDQEALIHSADTNLYAAKERGRNQVVFSTTL